MFVVLASLIGLAFAYAFALVNQRASPKVGVAAFSVEQTAFIFLAKSSIVAEKAGFASARTAVTLMVWGAVKSLGTIAVSFTVARNLLGIASPAGDGNNQQPTV